MYSIIRRFSSKGGDLIRDSVLDDEFYQKEATPYPIRLEFDHRFTVWTDIIHRNRSLDLLAVPDRQEFESLRERYTNLDLFDADRLIRRAHKEFIYHSTGATDTAVVGHRQILLYRIIRVEHQLNRQLLRYQRIADETWAKSDSYVYEHTVKQLRR